MFSWTKITNRIYSAMSLSAEESETVEPLLPRDQYSQGNSQQSMGASLGSHRGYHQVLHFKIDQEPTNVWRLKLFAIMTHCYCLLSCHTAMAICIVGTCYHGNKCVIKMCYYEDVVVMTLCQGEMSTFVTEGTDGNHFTSLVTKVTVVSLGCV